MKCNHDKNFTSALQQSYLVKEAPFFPSFPDIAREAILTHEIKIPEPITDKRITDDTVVSREVINLLVVILVGLFLGITFPVR